MAENKGNGTESPKLDSSKRGRGRGRGRGGRGKSEDGKFLYAIADDDGSNDSNLKLHKPVAAEREILRMAIKGGVPYYRLQKFIPREVDSEEGLLIVGVPAE
jgi:hypothetical protein